MLAQKGRSLASLRGGNALLGFMLRRKPKDLESGGLHTADGADRYYLHLEWRYKMKRILIVEDEKEVLTLLRDNLTRHNFHIETAIDGKDAIEKVKTFIPDLVLLDIMLPELDGLEVLRWIKKNKPEILVILATAKKEVEDIKTGYSLEADYYITKPYSMEEIFKGINVLKAVEEKEVN
jgi:CheY-like chemotaxis protein